jgi:putative flippase GtrA
MHGLADGSRDAAPALVLGRLRPAVSIVPQLSRYTAVSAAALALDFAIFLALTALAMRPSLAGVIGYATGMLLHYLLSIRFVFDARATAKAHTRLLGEFVATGMSGMAATALVIAAATGVLGLAPLPAKVLAAGISFLVIFALRRTVVFSACDVRDGTPAAYGRPFVRASVWRAMEVVRGWYGRLNQRALAPDFYAKFTVAGAVFFAVLELTYFLFSDPPSFWKPSLDAFGRTAIGRDFLNAWMGGRSALGEGPAAWFDFRVYNAFLTEFMGVADMHRYVWSYPPHVLLFLWPLGLLPYFPAFLLWTLSGFALFLYAARAGGVERGHLLFVAVAPAVAINVFIGQNGFFMAALLICGLACLDRRPVLSGVLFGFLTIKPQLGLLLPVVLVLTGRWRTIASAALTTAALVAATTWLYGPEIWTEYLAKVVPQQHYLQEHGDGLLFLQIPSIFYAARHVGLPLGFAWALQALMSAVTLAAVAWTYWRRRDPVLSTALLIVAIFLASPYTLNYDMVIFGWVLALLRQRGGNEPVDHYLIMALWTLPAAMMIAGLIYIPLAVLVLSAFAARLVWQMAHSEAGERAAEAAAT